MKNTSIIFTVSLFFLVTILACGRKKSDYTLQNNFCTFDSLKQKATDSLYLNPLFARNLLDKAIPACKDSTQYYTLQTLRAKSFFFTAQYDSVLYYIRQTLDYCQRQSTLTPSIHTLLADNYNLCGNKATRVSNNDSAIYFYQLAYDHYKQSDKQISLPDICTNIADAYVREGNYVQGICFYRQALAITDSLPDLFHSPFYIYYGLGQTYMELHDFETSNYFYELAEKFYDQMDVSEKFIYLNNRGTHFYTKEDYIQAFKYHKQAYQLVLDRPEFLYEQNVSKMNLGELYLRTGNLDSAQLFLDQASLFFKKIDNQTALYYIDTQQIALALKKGELAKANAIIHKVYNTPIEPTLIDIRKRQMEQYYVQTHDFQNAYFSLKEKNRQDDSIRNERIKMRVAEIDMRYKQDTTLMKQTIFIQKQQNDMNVLRQTTYVWIAVCIILILVSLQVFFYIKKQKAYMQMKHKNRVAELKMENIRNRISPHFIFNTLSRTLSHKETESGKEEELEGLVKLLRQNLMLTEKLCITLEEELDFVKTYIRLEAKRMESFIFHFYIAPEIETQCVPIPSMLIQIPVENAIKHGLRNKEGEKELNIAVFKEAGTVRIRIQDNGGGFSKVKERDDSRSTGTGLKVLTQTIQLLNEYNKEQIQISIHNIQTPKGENGCEVCFVLPDNYSYIL